MTVNEVLTHAQRVARLYKRALRTTESFALGKAEYRFNATVLRQRFDETRTEKDMRVQAQRLADAMEELRLGQHPDPIVFKNDPGGITFRRATSHLDWLFDQYHPWEQAQLRDFFEEREKLKEEYAVYFEKSLTKKYLPEPQII